MSWDEPDNDGGSPVTGYLVQWKDTGEEFSDTERRATVTDPRHQITGLTIGNEHTVSVAAINATGTGPAVTRSLLLVENPGVPREMMIEPGNQQLTVTLAATRRRRRLARDRIPSAMERHRRRIQRHRTPSHRHRPAPPDP